jgi:hypothetical protein
VLGKAYRAAYRNAYGEAAFKPYTHMTRHLEQCQMRVQYDLMRYSCQGQEHYGKLMKQIVRGQTNNRLGNKSMKKGSSEETYGVSYVEQAAQVIAYRKSLNQAVPVKRSEYSVQKKHIQQWAAEQKKSKSKKSKKSKSKKSRSKKSRSKGNSNSSTCAIGKPLSAAKTKQVAAAAKSRETRRTMKQQGTWAAHHMPLSGYKVEAAAPAAIANMP